MIFNSIELEDAIELCPEELQKILDHIEYTGTVDSDKNDISKFINNYLINKFKTTTLKDCFKIMLKDVDEVKNLTFDELIDSVLKHENEIKRKLNI